MIQRVVVLNVKDVPELKNVRATNAKKERREWAQALMDVVLYFILVGSLILAAAILE